MCLACISLPIDAVVALFLCHLVENMKKYICSIVKKRGKNASEFYFVQMNILN